jgi:DNA-directed RNA polymerase beta subunit
LPEAPLVSTGVEELAARDGGRLVIAENYGIVSYLDAKKITVKGKNEKTYNLVNFMRAEYEKRGYQEVITPVFYNKSLWGFI